MSECAYCCDPVEPDQPKVESEGEVYHIDCFADIRDAADFEQHWGAGR